MNNNHPLFENKQLLLITIIGIAIIGLLPTQAESAEVSGNNSIYTFLVQNCTSNQTNLTCNSQTIRFECNITPVALIDTVEFYIEGTYHTTTQNGSFWYYDYTKTEDYSDTNNPIEMTKQKIYDTNTGYVNAFQTVTIPRTCDVCDYTLTPVCDSCQTNDTQNCEYTSTNESCFASYNGTQTCNYCTPDWQPRTGGAYDCQTNNTKITYYDDFNTCYAITGLPTDQPPPDHDTTTACSYLTGDFNCTLDPEPYLQNKIPIICELPSSPNNNYKCQTYIKKDVGSTVLLQNNPEYTDRGNSLISFGTQDTRQYFNNEGQILNAHLSDKNLEEGNTFIAGVKCSNNDTIITYEQQITPTRKGLNNILNWTIYLKNNVAFIALGFFILFFLVAGLGIIIRHYKREVRQ